MEWNWIWLATLRHKLHFVVGIFDWIKPWVWYYKLGSFGDKKTSDWLFPVELFTYICFHMKLVFMVGFKFLCSLTLYLGQFAWVFTGWSLTPLNRKNFLEIIKWHLIGKIIRWSWSTWLRGILSQWNSKLV